VVGTNFYPNTAGKQRNLVMSMFSEMCTSLGLTKRERPTLECNLERGVGIYFNSDPEQWSLTPEDASSRLVIDNTVCSAGCAGAVTREFVDAFGVKQPKDRHRTTVPIWPQGIAV